MTNGRRIKYISFIHHKIRHKLSSSAFRSIYAKEFGLYEANIYIGFFSSEKIKQNIMPCIYFTKTYIRRWDIPYTKETIEIIDKQYNHNYILNEKILPSITSHLFSS